MFYDAYIQEAAQLFDIYKLQEPLHVFLKKYFNKRKKFGSRDRKLIANLLYNVYRLGNKNATLPWQEKIVASSLLAANMPISFYEKVIPHNVTILQSSFEERFSFLQKKYDLDWDIYGTLNEGISQFDFIQNLFSSPKVFIRIRKNLENVLHSLQANAIQYEIKNNHCISVAANTPLQTILNSDDYTIQDVSSQIAGDIVALDNAHTLWDTCCGSGGKSLQWLDKKSDLQILATDIRNPILKTYRERLSQYGYTSIETLQADLSNLSLDLINRQFDLIVCDAPCSGSGTWARNPEQYYFFTGEKLLQYQSKQKMIWDQLLQVKSNVKYYITCSIFEEENEWIVKGEKKYNICNFNKNGDAMYVAVCEKG